MDPGELDQLIMFQNVASKSRGASGEEIDNWADWKKAWASIKTSGGSESFYNPQLVAMSTHKLKLHYMSGINPLMRVRWGVRILDIVHVDDSRRRQGELYLLCQERVT